MKKRFGWSKNAMSLDTVITADNVMEIGEKLTVGNLKMLVGYRGEVALRLYKMHLKTFTANKVQNTCLLMHTTTFKLLVCTYASIWTKDLEIL